tara:strand:- start:1426 stop:2505 length:1080 start_codon:yes stop_codon:yes gene_type:complete
MKPSAQLVFDGVHFYVPPPCGSPREDQLQGTLLERLCELAGRECYDSLGRGRSSADYHRHILEVGHLSVYEHANFTVQIQRGSWLQSDLIAALVNRPGIFVSAIDRDTIHVTANLRTCLEWEKWQAPSRSMQSADNVLHDALVLAAHRLAPQVVREFIPRLELISAAEFSMVVPPEHPEERWVTLRLAGSRGMSHEQVRHGDRTAISQRSTRYVNEADAEWCWHPLIHAHIVSGDEFELRRFTSELRDSASSLYRRTVNAIQIDLQAQGVDAGTARKQARGAARGALGNALGTSMIFSASVAQWQRMLQQRMHPAADAEIRVLYGEILSELKRSVHGHAFEGMVTAPSPDGIGRVLRSG